jgi:hypothetical protein
MARATRKPSRRRAAALKFLSSISFETNTAQREIICDEVLIVEEEKRLMMQQPVNNETMEVNEFMATRFIEMECVKSSMFTSYRDR